MDKMKPYQQLSPDSRKRMEEYMEENRNKDPEYPFIYSREYHLRILNSTMELFESIEEYGKEK